MRLSAVAFCMILTTIFLSACGKQEMAAVEDHGGNFYSKHGVLSLANAAPVGAAVAAPLAQAPIQHSIADEYAALSSAPKAQAAPLPQKPIMAASNSWQWPVTGQVIETYGEKSGGVTNEGIVISSNEGTPIRAAQAGEVAFVGKDTKTYGNIVILRHADGDMSSYAHARDINVTKGQHVAAGAVIGTVGRSGNAKAPQLHFAVREGGASIDPLTKLPHSVAMN